MAIKQSILREKAQSYAYTELQEKSAANERQDFSNTKIRTAFLCHSHKDRYLAKGLKVLLKEQGVSLYIDWEDQSMPETPNKETADKIRGYIKAADVFLFLATANSKASRWCPWEIGYADGENRSIYIVPTEADGTYYGNEYLDLYPYISDGKYIQSERPGYFVFPNRKDHGSSVSSAL